MYTLHLGSGTVTRDSDLAVCSPAQSITEELFIEYNNWVNEGNHPSIDNTPVVFHPTVITSQEFKDRFTNTELLGFLSLAQTDATAKLLLLEAEVATEVHLQSQRTIQGVQYLASQGIITSERATEILS